MSLSLSLSLLLSLCFRKIKNQPQSFITQNHIKNPENFYWINRSDGSGLHDYGKDENYLVLSIKPFYTTACSDKVTCKELNSKCIDGVCVPYSNAEIYNGTCCDTFATLGDTNEVTTLFNVADKYRIALLKMVCEKQKSIAYSIHQRLHLMIRFHKQDSRFSIQLSTLLIDIRVLHKR